MARARGRCEGCGKLTDALQGAHIFGRRARVGEPWASSRYLVAGLCYYDPFTDLVGCHEKIDRYLDPSLRDRLEERHARMLAERFSAPYASTQDPIQNVRFVADAVGYEEMRERLHLRTEDGARSR